MTDNADPAVNKTFAVTMIMKYMQACNRGMRISFRGRVSNLNTQIYSPHFTYGDVLRLHIAGNKKIILNKKIIPLLT